MRNRPAPLGGGNRAESNRNIEDNTIAGPQPEADFAALYLARRYRLALPLAHAVAILAQLGGRFA